MSYKPEKNLQDQLKDESKSAFERYRLLAVGNDSLWYLCKYELVMLFTSWVPGALGFILRKLFYPSLLGSVGTGVIFGRNVGIRHGLKVHVGDNVTIDDNVLLDAKGSDNSGLSVGAGTILSRNTILSCKDGNINIGARCTIGINSLVHSMPGSDINIGDDVLCGAYCYFIGSGPYISEELDVPFKQQGFLPQGGITVANNVWLGSNVQVMDGVTIQTGSIVGTSSVVNKSIGAYEVSAGVPVKTIKHRKKAEKTA
ncbi:MAG: DapH/DapD/GlmU-related protein [Arenicella sp.]